MRLVRTPDERFASLPDFSFTPHYLDIDGKRIHYVDEGQGSTILCLHGEPTWSFLYRQMIPILAQSRRVLAFDFVGFGRSDKLTAVEDYSFELHQHTLLGFIKALNLNEITLVVHDWGGLIGLPTAAAHPDYFARLVILNTFLPTGEEPPSRGFLAWRRAVERAAPDLPIGTFMQRALPAALPAVIAGYEAPFPDVSYKAGAVAFPLMVPLETTDPVAGIMRNARQQLRQWTKPTLVMFATDDPILGAAAPFFRDLIPAAREQPEILFESGGHFLQEAHSPALARQIVDFMQRSEHH
jgi:haloalkane dehalogenase